MKIVAEFQYTFEEFKEGLEALQKAASKPKTPRRSVFGWILFVGLAVVLFSLLNMRGGASGTGPSQAPRTSPKDVLRDFAGMLLPWALVAVVVGFLVFRTLRQGYRKAWDAEPPFHRPRVIEIDEEGISLADSVSRHRTLWEAYTKFVETRNLFLLFLSDRQAELIPKRAFHSDEEVRQARELFASRISPPQSAFPVIPIERR